MDFTLESRPDGLLLAAWAQWKERHEPLARSALSMESGVGVGARHIATTLVTSERETDLGVCNACSTHKSYEMDALYVCSMIFYRNIGNNVSQS